MKAEGVAVAELLALLGSEHAASEQGTACIRRVSAPNAASQDCLVFAEDDRTLEAALASEAGVIFAPRTAVTEDRRVIRVEDPRYAFALCAKQITERQESHEPAIHPTATVHETARLGARVRVGAGTVIEAGAVIGDDTRLGSHVVIGADVVLGQRVVIQSGAVLGALGFGYVRHRETGEYLPFPQQGTLTIEEDVEIGANTTIDRGSLDETRIGRGTKIDNLVHIGHNCRIGRNVIIAAQVGISGSCVVGDGAILAGQVGISDHCQIGPGVVLGGQAGVYRGKTVNGPGEVFAGTPAEPLREQMRALARLRRLR